MGRVKLSAFPPSIKEFVNFDKPESGGIFFFSTPERYIFKCFKAELREIAAKNGGEELYCFDTDDQQNAVSEAIGAAREISFFGTGKVVLLNLPEKLAESDQKALDSYIDRSEFANYLIVFITSIDKRSKFYKRLQKLNKNYFEVEPPTTAELKGFIKKTLSPITADDEIYNFFLNSPNRDMFYISNEIDKLRLYAESRGKQSVSYSEADALLNELSEQKIFKILDFLIRKQIPQAIRLYRETIILETEQRVNSVMLSMFFKHFEALLAGKIMKNEGRQGDFFSYMQEKRIFYMRNNAMAVVDSYKNREITNALSRLSQIEAGMKGAENAKLTSTTEEIEIFMAEFFR